MKDLRIINPVVFEGWDDFVASFSGASFFHSSAWAKVLSEAYKYKPTYFTLFDRGVLRKLRPSERSQGVQYNENTMPESSALQGGELYNKKLTGLLPIMDINSLLTGRRGVSLPFTDFCEPIADDGVPFSKLFDYAVSYGKENGWKYIELRGGQHFLPDALPSQTFLAHILDLLPDEDKMMVRLRDNTRRNIRKAIAEGVTGKILHTLEAVKEFYRLNCFTRKEHGLPPQPERFFKAVHKHIISRGQGFVALAYFQGKAIAGNIYFHSGDKVIYKYGASDKRYQNLRASNLAMWEAIKWCCHHGRKELHFGRTEYAHQGLRQFKAGWGTREQTIAYLRYDLNRMEFVSIKQKGTDPFRGTIFKKTPVPVLKVIGSIAYRHMG